MQNQVGVPEKLMCRVCQYQGFMQKKRPGWVTPVALIGILFTAGFSLLLFLIPKKFACPQCGAFLG